ncbi:MAG: alpha/beta hydrolase-fold protein [Pseudomonadota bacterium]
MRHTLTARTIAIALLAAGCSAPPNLADGSTEDKVKAAVEQTLKSENLIEHTSFPSAFVKPRNITVWLPESYNSSGSETYPVIYAHDGQNLFEPDRSYGGVEWELDEAASKIMKDGTVGPSIIVGIWNTDERWQEYAPQKVVESLSGDTSSEWLGPHLPELKADAYLRFITEELKPFIDETYATRPDREHTHIMGSSMGGLISLYAVAEYPATFSRAAAVSIHWPLTEPEGAVAQQADEAMKNYLTTSGLTPSQHTIWFDHGTETLDAAYPPHASVMETWFREQGWDSDQAIFRTYPGTNHSEKAWAARAEEVLTFLLSED